MTDPADLVWMRRAIAMAGPALGRTWPNPAVGCVLVKGGVVLAEAATAPGGRPHAEEQALALALGQARGADAYITLEPCANRSNGSCACSDRLIEAGVRRVVIACANPDARSAGQGLERLASSGIRVDIGLLREEAQGLYRGFLHRLRTGRPLLESARDGAGFDGPFQPLLHETLEGALRRYGQAGYTRLWTETGSELAEAAAAQGLLGEAGAH